MTQVAIKLICDAIPGMKYFTDEPTFNRLVFRYKFQYGTRWIHLYHQDHYVHAIGTRKHDFTDYESMISAIRKTIEDMIL